MKFEKEDKNQDKNITGLTNLFGAQDPKKCRKCDRPSICSEPEFVCCYHRNGKEKDCLTCSDRLCRVHFKQKIEGELG